MKNRGFLSFLDVIKRDQLHEVDSINSFIKIKLRGHVRLEWIVYK